LSVSVIRPAVPSDRAFVLALAARLVDGFDPPTHRTRAELIEGDRRALEAWFDNPSNTDEAMFIAEVDGKPAGCAFLVTLIDYFNERPHSHLSVLVVEKHAEGQGVGRTLLGASERWARERGSDRLTLSALVTNTHARTIYERRGYTAEYIRFVLRL
jgi:GNAT superfamily N-acetyltransferase